MMVARGAMGNPWIFSEIAAALEHRPYTPPTADERLSLIKEHIAVHIAEKGERALPELRKHLSWYIHGLPGSAAARAEINKATTGQELYSLLARVFLPQ